MNCLACIPVVDTNAQESKDVLAVTNQGTKKVVISTVGGKVLKEEQETIHEGLLKLKAGSIAYSWKTVKIVVELKNILLYEKRGKAPTKILPLHICSVRPVSTRRFRVCCAPNAVLELKAATNKLMREWVTSIQDGVSRRLSAQTECKTHCGTEILTALRKANEANRYCADCHAPDPKWISISIGCIICIECSGVHRHLGSTISKVRSFELDIWDERNEAIEKIGNADVNSVFEANLTPGHEKPSATSDRGLRERYIYNKYVCKLYRQKSSMTPIINTQSKKKVSSVCILPTNERYPTHKRNGSHKAIHIGSDVFAPQITQISATKFNPIRRGSIVPDFARRGSVAGSPRRGSLGAGPARKDSLEPGSLRRGSLAPVNATPKLYGGTMRRHSLHQSRL